nr:unnamed protein product [Callosobruchus analis]
MEWINELCLQLIDLYEPVLWESSNSFCCSKNKKNAARQEIAGELNIDVKVIMQEISSLLGSFWSQKSKGKKRIGTGK